MRKHKELDSGWYFLLSAPYVYGNPVRELAIPNHALDESYGRA
jgi:hypothetical protein